MFKKVFLFAIVAVLLSCAVNAQPFFKPLHKLKSVSSTQQNFLFQPVVTSTDSTFTAFRPIITAAIGITANKTTKAMGGTGLSFQNITYNYASQKFTVNWAISALALAGGSVTPTTTTNIMSYGLMFSFNNNTTGVGAFITGEKQNGSGKTIYYVGPMFTTNINFNN